MSYECSVLCERPEEAENRMERSELHEKAKLFRTDVSI